MHTRRAYYQKFYRRYTDDAGVHPCHVHLDGQREGQREECKEIIGIASI